MACSLGSPTTRKPSRWMPLMRFGPLMSSRAITRRCRWPISGPAAEDGVSQFPLAAFLPPQVRRTEGVGQLHEVGTVHRRRLEHLRGLREFLGRDAEVAEDFVGEALRELAVVAPHQGDALVARDVAGADLLRRIVGCAANAELGEGRVVVEVVDAIVDAVVLAVGAGR